MANTSTKNVFLVPHKRYVHGITKQEIVFIGMAHLWPRELFTQVTDWLTFYRNQDYRIHHEGVRKDDPEPTGVYARYGRSLSDELNKLYRQIATLAKGKLVFQRDVAGLYSSQDSLTSDVTQGELLRELGFIRCNIFVGLLKFTSKLIEKVDADNDNVAETILEKLSTVAEEDPKIPLVAGALVDFRNRELMKKVLASSENAVLPWGIGHGVGLEKILLAHGFVLTADNSVNVSYSL